MLTCMVRPRNRRDIATETTRRGEESGCELSCEQSAPSEQTTGKLTRKSCCYYAQIVDCKTMYTSVYKPMRRK